MMCKMQLQNDLSGQVAVSLDAVGRRAGLARAQVCRAAAIDPSTIWRAVTGKGRARLSTLADFGEATLGMMTRKGHKPDLATPEGADLIRRAASWAADRREDVAAGEQVAAELTVAANLPWFRQRYGAAGEAFSNFVSLKASGASLSEQQRLVLASLGIFLLQGIEDRT